MMPENRPPVKSSGHRRPEKPSMRVKDGRKQPFVWFPPELLPQYGAAIGAYAGWVYMSLLTHLNRKRGSCYLSQKTIATETGMSIAQAKVSLKKLETLGLIAITTQRPKVSIYEVLDLPDHAANSQQVAIDVPSPNSQVGAINSQQVAINSQQVAIEQLVGSYEPEVVVPEVEDQSTTTTTTRAAPKSTDVVEVVKDFAVAPSEEAKTMDGFMAGAMVPPWRQFFDAYPTHRCPEKVEAEWDRQQLDSMLPDILEALSWQVELTGHAALPCYPHVYLKDGRWRDRRPVASAARTVSGAWADETHRCKAPGCNGKIPSTLSDTRCDDHAMGYLEDEATEALRLLRQCPEDATVDVLEDAIWGLVHQFHRNGGATAILEMIVGYYQNISEGQLTSVFVAKEIGRVVAKHREQPRLAVLN